MTMKSTSSSPTPASCYYIPPHSQNLYTDDYGHTFYSGSGDPTGKIGAPLKQVPSPMLGFSFSGLMKQQTLEEVAPKAKGNQRYKTELCRPFAENGFCKYGEKCQFAHGEPDLRSTPRHPKYKTEKCRTFHTEGFCPYGHRCHFVHNPESEEERGVFSPDSGIGLFRPSQPPTPTRRAQLSIQAAFSSASSAGSPVPSTGSTSPSSFGSSDFDAFHLFPPAPHFYAAPAPAPVQQPKRDVQSDIEQLTSSFESMFTAAGNSERLPVFSRISSATA